jgi:hypothetical protein
MRGLPITRRGRLFVFRGAIDIACLDFPGMEACSAMNLCSIGALIVSLLLSGCASNPKSYTGEDGITYRQEHDIQGVWMADGFAFKSYDTVLVAEPTSTAESRSDEERKVLEMARRTLRQELANALDDTHIFQRVVTSTNDIPANARLLVLQNNIYHHEKGGGGARYFAGAFGGGQPVIKVNGIMAANNQPMFRYDMERSGESGGARLGGAFMSDENIQTEDIKDLARDLAAFVNRTAKGLPAK